MIFKYDPETGRADFDRLGYAHLKDIMSDDFIEYLEAFYKRSEAEAAPEATDWKIYGKKRQFVFDFPSPADANEFRAGMARLTGLDEDTFTISERHLKVYDEDAQAWPAPHKDRAASQISIGLPIKLPEGSSVCVFPDMERGPNTEERAVFLTDRDHPDLSHIYQNEKAVLLNESIGDLVVFWGSAIFHERVNAANAAILYIKANSDGRDPLGENIFETDATKADA